MTQGAGVPSILSARFPRFSALSSLGTSPASIYKRPGPTTTLTTITAAQAADASRDAPSRGAIPDNIANSTTVLAALRHAAALSGPAGARDVVSRIAIG